MKKITPKQYATALYQSLQERPKEAESVFDNFLAFVWRNKDWKNLSKILISFGKVIALEENLLEAQALSAAELGAGLKKKIQSWLENSTGKQAALKYQVDQSLLGGVVIKYDDLIMDASIKNQLANLEKQLIHN